MRGDSIGNRLVLVGPGRAGLALVTSWTGAGGEVVVIARSAAAAERLRIDSVEVRSYDDPRPLAGDVLVLAVPDDAIEPVAGAVAPRAACRFSFHLSGALSSIALSPLARTCAVGSLHPLRAFTGAPGETWRGSFVAVEGDEGAAEAGSLLCRRIEARPRRLAGGDKPLYHCAATLAAGGVASLLSLAARIWEEAGLEPEEGRIELARLAEGAAHAVARLPFPDALTGPVARRDVETVRLHREALSGRPDLARLYGELALETLRRTAGRGREAEIRRIVEPGAEASAKKPDSPAPKG